MSRLYAVPVRFFFTDETSSEEWEEALRHRAAELSVQGKAGIGALITAIANFVELHQRNDQACPGRPHMPFAALAETDRSADEIQLCADRARHHFDLGMAPLHDVRGFLEAQNGIASFRLPSDNKPAIYLDSTSCIPT